MEAMKKFWGVWLVGVLALGLLGPRGAAQAVLSVDRLASGNQVSASLTLRSLAPAGQKVDTRVQAALAQAGQGSEMISVIVTLRQQADLRRVNAAGNRGRGEQVVRALQAARDLTQAPLARLLAERQAKGLVQAYQPFWVFNGFSLSATAVVITELAARPEVFSVTPDALDIVPALGPAESNIAAIHAPALWGLGYTGQGVVVAALDSGVDAAHPDLAASYRGGTNSWFDPYNQHPASPYDPNGHGTLTMGLMVGADAGGTTIGAAPGAKWIAARIFNDAGGATASAIHLAFQWLLDPDGDPATADQPDVVNNSWTYGAPGCNLSFEPDLAALRAAGILPLFAAGNGGPGSASSYSPANNPSAFAVGAVGAGNVIYSGSSRGPSSCGGRSGPFPDVVAPGVNVRSSDLFGQYSSASGTSMAAPQVAGALALLLSAYPHLAVDTQAAALRQSALELGDPGPDDVFGYGLVDAQAAYNWLAAQPTATPSPSPTPTPSPTPPGAPSGFTLNLPLVVSGGP